MLNSSMKIKFFPQTESTFTRSPLGGPSFVELFFGQARKVPTVWLLSHIFCGWQATKNSFFLEKDFIISLWSESHSCVLIVKLFHLSCGQGIIKNLDVINLTRKIG